MGLRAKMYAFTADGEDDKKKGKEHLVKHLKCKGIKTCVVKKKLNIDLYRDVLFSRSKLSVEQNGIRSYKHQLYTETVNKVALSGIDDNLFICKNNIDTLNFNHYKTKQIDI